jgi:hypothetical protein
MNLIQDNHLFTQRVSIHNIVRVLAWFMATIFMLNALYFVLRVTSPVIQSDSWYFLNVFLRKAIDGNLSFADFFVRRAGADHAQPLFKLILLFEWRYFDLDFTVEAVIGVVAVAACALIFYRLMVAECRDNHGDTGRYMAWIAMCAVLFSLNGGGQTWTWSLVALENVTTVIVLVFMLTVWHAHRTQRYLALVFVTLLLGITSDDSALIAALAAVLALLLVQVCDPTQRRRSTWITLFVIGACMFVVRIGYAHAPVIGGSPSTSIQSNLGLLFDHFQHGGWWQWVLLPLVLPVFYQNPFQSAHAGAWMAIQIVMGALLVIAHVWFWKRALGSKYNRAIFVAVCLMLLSYAWVAGIILGRVAIYGNDYLNQPRYVLLYAGHLVALLLMWAGSPAAPMRTEGRWRAIGKAVPVVGCVALLAIQVPLSIKAWHVRPYQWLYDIQMAKQIDELAKDPVHAVQCGPQLPVCGWPLEQRRELTQLLSENRLNIYSPWVQHWHDFLPRLSPTSPVPAPATTVKPH